MNVTQQIVPSRCEGTITAPASKSMMQRAIAAAYLSGGTCTLTPASLCDDSRAALRVVNTLGAQSQVHADRIDIAPGETATDLVLDCGESGFSFRMFSAIAALLDRDVTLVAQGGLQSRPVTMIEAPLHALGVTCRTHNGFPPVTIRGPIHPGPVTVDAAITSQFLSGLLMALPLCPGDSEIIVPSLKSKPYVKMTLELLSAFGIEIAHERLKRFQIRGNQRYTPISYNVEGDWSGAAFLLVAGAIAGTVQVENLNLASLQADKAILEVLQMSGADVQIDADAVEVRERPLTAFEFDATDCPDLFPPLVALAACCEGRSIIHGAQRLTHKECDRGAALQQEFTKLGIAVELFPDRLEITGGAITGGEVEAHNDHRIAMAEAVAGLKSQHGVTIQGWECVAKSYPDFFDDLNNLRTE